MPSFNRRGFLQLISTAAVTPFLPAMPTRAVAATASGSTSKALWAGIYAKSGSASKFVGVARNMGLSNAAIQGVSARSVGVRIALAAAAPSAPAQGTGNLSRDIIRKIEDHLTTESDMEEGLVEDDSETASDLPDTSKVDPT